MTTPLSDPVLITEPGDGPEAVVPRTEGGGEQAAGEEQAGGRSDGPGEEASAVRVAVAAGLAAAAGGWVFAGVFDSWLARLLGLLAPALGAAVAALAATRYRQNVLAAWAAVPVAVVAGWLVVLPDGAAAPRLVVEALRSGGISQPPVPFDPGWRFLLVAIVVLAASAAAGLALSAGNALLAPLLGAGMVVAGVLVQPTDGALIAVCGALVLLAAAMAVAVGGESGGGFEARRLGRGAAALAGLVAFVVVLSQLGFLFPDNPDHQVIPPKRPEVPPAAPDRVLFRVKADRPLPLRLGVLDVYDGRGFLTPPYDSERFRPIDRRPASGGVRVAITVEDLGGHLLPGLAEPQAVTGTGAKVEVDPRTGQLRLPKARARKGLTYTVIGGPVPSAGALDESGPAPGALKEFTDVPAPPKLVADLLAAAPGPSTPYSRVQFVRAALYNRVVAAGAGNPKDVPPSRVVDFLDGKEASPFEITAAEVLLARWAGVPARLGYGYYDPSGAAEVRPRNGATWLEAYFEGSGWVPVVGSPPRAKSSFTRAPKKQDPLVRPTDALALVVYVPVRLTTVQLLYTLVRYWLLRVLPLLLAAGLAWALLPVALRALRRWRRRRWATGRGAPDRLLVAYAELRDAAIDLNVGRPDMTALEFTEALAPDDEHRQLAWLVTRGLWGDLQRDLAESDVKAAEDMAASVARRLRRAQPTPNRFGGMVSRASLADPWSTEIPSLHLRRRLDRRLAVLVALLAVGFAVSAIKTGDGADQVAGGGVPGRVAPGRVGDVELRPEPTVEKAFAEAGPSTILAEGRLLSVRRGDDLEGSLQVAAFKPGITAAEGRVRRAVVKSIGRGQFRLTRIGSLRAYVLDLPEQRFLLWFPPDGRSYDLLVTRSTFDQADRLLTQVVAYQQGRQGAQDERPVVPVPDPRRGAPE
jgi:hypothetical protein